MCAGRLVARQAPTPLRLTQGVQPSEEIANAIEPELVSRLYLVLIQAAAAFIL
jgi:hypothetical protein